jgi:hypothetical protein
MRKKTRDSWGRESDRRFRARRQVVGKWEGQVWRPKRAAGVHVNDRRGRERHRQRVMWEAPVLLRDCVRKAVLEG